jgi:hypothetical protein
MNARFAFFRLPFLVLRCRVEEGASPARAERAVARHTTFAPHSLFPPGPESPAAEARRRAGRNRRTPAGPGCRRLTSRTVFQRSAAAEARSSRMTCPARGHRRPADTLSVRRDCGSVPPGSEAARTGSGCLRRIRNAVAAQVRAPGALHQIETRHQNKRDQRAREASVPRPKVCVSPRALRIVDPPEGAD